MEAKSERATGSSAAKTVATRNQCSDSPGSDANARTASTPLVPREKEEEASPEAGGCPRGRIASTTSANAAHTRAARPLR